jgi:DNA-binding transcriptional LysR family regulator
MEFRINDLQNFTATAACRTMMDAAKKLGITQPALSESIKRLEADLGSVLFYRSRSGISLTSSGKQLYDKARVTLAQLTELSPNREAQAFAGRSITIGCHPVVASYVLPEALQKLEKSAPDFQVLLKHDLSRNIQLGIQKGVIDVGIIINPIPSPDLVIKKLAMDEVSVWAKDPKEKYSKIFCNLELVQTQTILRKWARHPAQIMDSESLELIVRLTERGLGYGIIPTRAVNLLGASLTQIAGLPVFRDEICLVHRPEFGKMGFERLLSQCLKDALATST